MTLLDTLAHVGYLSVEECNQRFGEAAVEAAYTAGTVRRHREWSGCLTLATPECWHCGETDRRLIEAVATVPAMFRCNVCGGMLAPD